jgi:hypothetical protein
MFYTSLHKIVISFVKQSEASFNNFAMSMSETKIDSSNLNLIESICI